jgi:hypothetical protein
MDAVTRVASASTTTRSRLEDAGDMTSDGEVSVVTKAFYVVHTIGLGNENGLRPGFWR